MLYNFGCGPINEGLPRGYIQLEYIASTGTQWIDSGVNCTTNYLTCEFDGISYNTVQGAAGYNGIFGATGGSPSPRWYVTRHSTKWNVGWSSGSTGYVEIGTCDNNRHLFKLQNNISGTHFYIDGTALFTNKAGTARPDKNFYIMAINDATTVVPSANFCYSFKIYSNDILIRDFIPCIRNNDGAVGLYDLCGSSSPFDNTPFYGNSGTGVFYPGPILSYSSLIEKHTTNVGTYGTVSASQYKSGYAGNAYMAVDGSAATVADVYYGSAYANGTYIQYIWNTAIKHIDYILVAGFIDGAGTITTGTIQYTLDGTNWTTAVTLNNTNFINNYSSGISDTGVNNLYSVNLNNIKGIRIGSTASSNSRGMIIKELWCYGQK